MDPFLNHRPILYSDLSAPQIIRSDGSTSNFTCYKFNLIPSFYAIGRLMTEEKLIETIQRVLNTDIDLGFLAQLKKTELETLLACIRHEVGR